MQMKYENSPYQEDVKLWNSMPTDVKHVIYKNSKSICMSSVAPYLLAIYSLVFYMYHSTIFAHLRLITVW